MFIGDASAADSSPEARDLPDSRVTLWPPVPLQIPTNAHPHACGLTVDRSPTLVTVRLLTVPQLVRKPSADLLPDSRKPPENSQTLAKNSGGASAVPPSPFSHFFGTPKPQQVKPGLAETAIARSFSQTRLCTCNSCLQPSNGFSLEVYL
ncbi:hypothetical protein AMTR_s00036p00085800 [Amborella trichopoda]|uniref:Uncharacterized protein n=1 Tax=Amborella trichopoda TaxID=13333 RepID=U5CZA6_AMBTC|nr:hypothetical protein AMTR_s00036p00085800 [Amborella trichopoda]